ARDDGRHRAYPDGGSVRRLLASVRWVVIGDGCWRDAACLQAQSAQRLDHKLMRSAALPASGAGPTVGNPFGDGGSMSGLPESDTAASVHEPHDEVPCPIIKCCAAAPPISATTMSAASTTKRATINPVLLSTRPAIQFGVSSPHDQSSEAPFGRATV